MKKILYLLSVVFGLILIGCSNEDSPIIPSYEGVVVNSLTNQPFEGITVSVTNGSNTKLSTTTNTQGEFNFSLNTEGLSGEYYIQIGNSNTEKKQIQITGIGKIENNLGIIKIEPDTKPLCKITKVEFADGTIIITGAIESSGFSNITAVGFYISKLDKVTNESISIRATLDGENFVATYEDNKLDIATEYYFIPFAINGCGEGLGSSYKYVTDDCTPIVDWQSYPSTPISVNSATSVIMNAEIQNNGGSEIIESGFCWDTTGQPNIESNRKYITGTSNYYSIEISDLTPSTKYYARPYVKNQRGGLGYGTIRSFETASGLPSVRTDRAVATSNTIGLWGEVTSNGGFEITKCGFCYGTDPNPTIQDNVIEYVQPKIGIYSVTISNVLDGTRYYARAFAQNTNGISYGNDIEINTYISVNFKVIDTNNNIVSQASIFIDGERYKCNDNGELSLLLLTGYYNIYAKDGDYKSTAKGFTITRYTKDFTIEIQKPAITVSIDESGFSYTCTTSGQFGTKKKSYFTITNHSQSSKVWTLSNVPMHGLQFDQNTGSIAAGNTITVNAEFTYPGPNIPYSLKYDVLFSMDNTPTQWLYLWDWDNVNVTSGTNNHYNGIATQTIRLNIDGQVYDIPVSFLTSVNNN